VTIPRAGPSAQALGESLAALAAQVADLRGQVALISQRLDRAGIRDDVDLVARFEELAATVATAFEPSLPAGRPLPAGSAWTTTPTTRGWPSCGGGLTPYCASTTAAMSGTAGPLGGDPGRRAAMMAGCQADSAELGYTMCSPFPGAVASRVHAGLRRVHVGEQGPKVRARAGREAAGRSPSSRARRTGQRSTPRWWRPRRRRREAEAVRPGTPACGARG
jgi:hypothetical protein